MYATIQLISKMYENRNCFEFSTNHFLAHWDYKFFAWFNIQWTEKWHTRHTILCRRQPRQRRRRIRGFEEIDICTVFQASNERVQFVKVVKMKQLCYLVASFLSDKYDIPIWKKHFNFICKRIKLKVSQCFRKWFDVIKPKIE